MIGTVRDVTFSDYHDNATNGTDPWSLFYRSLPKIAWASDIHLNRMHENAPRVFGESIRKETGVNKLIISGDISTSHYLIRTLKELRDGFGGKIYFVLGNHDYWGSKIDYVRDDVRRLSKKTKRLVWLDEIDSVNLNGIALLGSGGIYDIRLGLGTR